MAHSAFAAAGKKSSPLVENHTQQTPPTWMMMVVCSRDFGSSSVRIHPSCAKAEQRGPSSLCPQLPPSLQRPPFGRLLGFVFIIFLLLCFISISPIASEEETNRPPKLAWIRRCSRKEKHKLSVVVCCHCHCALGRWKWK